MPLAHSNGSYIFFAHVPKTGGSSVTGYLTQRFGPLAMAERFDSTGALRSAATRQRGVILPVDHLAAADLERFLPQGLAWSFAVVRDPMARILSEYRFQAGISRMSRLGFSTWLRVMLRAAERDPRIYENHLRPQGDLVPEGAEVFRLEDGLASMIARLDMVTGATAPGVEIPHLLKSGKASVTLRRQDADLIARFYAGDYARFSYAMPDLQALPPDPAAPLREALAWGLARLVVWKQRRDWITGKGP
jgi:Sulfotransferase family